MGSKSSGNTCRVKGYPVNRNDKRLFLDCCDDGIKFLEAMKEEIQNGKLSKANAKKRMRFWCVYVEGTTKRYLDSISLLSERAEWDEDEDICQDAGAVGADRRKEVL